MHRIPSLFAVIVLASACAVAQPWWLRDLQEWEGAPVSELLDAWGPPLQTLTSEDEATVLVYESARQLDHRLEDLREPGARIGADRGLPMYRPVDRSECTLYFEIAADEVTAARHEGAACEIVPRDPRRRQADPVPRRRR